LVKGTSLAEEAGYTEQYFQNGEFLNESSCEKDEEREPSSSPVRMAPPPKGYNSKNKKLDVK
jgi:hypothetical protein